MAPLNNFVLLILFTISLNLFTNAAEERGAIPSEQEKQLKAINKPAIKSFKTEHGDIFDCIDIHKQLAFDHHLLKNHSVQLKPTTIPKWITRSNISHKASPLKLLQEDINCPDGTVIVKRTIMQDLMNAQRLKSMGFDGPKHFITERNNTHSTGHYYAAVDYGDISVTGVKGSLNLWDPQVLKDQVSLAFMTISGGPIQRVGSISVGWMVNPMLYQNDHVHLYTYWSARGNNPGCYDIRCPGFVQISQRIPLGVLLQPVSIYDGPQYQLDLCLYQDRVKGDWWFVFGGEYIGYWPASLFIASSLVNRANFASWGGETYSPFTEKTPDMGSGHWPWEGFGKAAYVNGIKIVDGSGKVLDPKIDRVEVRESSPTCYRAIYVRRGSKSDPWTRAVYYGGPAGCLGRL